MYDITHKHNLNNDTNELIYKTENRITDLENKLMATYGGEGGGRHGEFGTDMYILGEGNGTPLQYSCLENPMDEEPGRLQSMGLRRVGHD